MDEPKTKGKLSATQIILIAGILIIVIAIGVVGYLVLNKPEPEAVPGAVAATPGSGNLVIDNGFDADDMRRRAAENMFEVKMNQNWSFPDGTSPSSDAYVANSKANNKSFYFDVTLSDTGEVVYTSPIIPLGSAVKNFALNKGLEAGSYKCICNYYLLNEDETVANTVSVTVWITIDQ